MSRPFAVRWICEVPGCVDGFVGHGRHGYRCEECERFGAYDTFDGPRIDLDVSNFELREWAWCLGWLERNNKKERARAVAELKARDACIEAIVAASKENYSDVLEKSIEIDRARKAGVAA